jgi:hypothetical protein
LKLFLFGLTIFCLNLQFAKGSADAEPWSTSRFKNVRIETLKSDLSSQAPTSYSFPLNIVIVDGTKWTREFVLEHISKIQKIYKACDMQADPINLIYVSPPKGYTEFSAPHDQEIADMIPDGVTRPILFLMGGIDTGEAYGSNDFAPGSPRINLHETAWLSQIVRTSDYAELFLKKGYDPLAHELAHILCDCFGHIVSDEPNLSNQDGQLLSGDLMPYQCMAFQKSILLKIKRD